MKYHYYFKNGIRNPTPTCAADAYIVPPIQARDASWWDGDDCPLPEHGPLRRDEDDKASKIDDGNDDDSTRGVLQINS